MFTYNGITYHLMFDGEVRASKEGEWLEPVAIHYQYHAARMALIDVGKAMTYVWGRQDAGMQLIGVKEEVDTKVSEDFAQAYGAHVFRYRIGDHWCMETLRSAYELWRDDKLETGKRNALGVTAADA